MKKIKITAHSELSHALYETPQAAIKALPQWFKEMPSTIDNKKRNDWEFGKGPNFTMKKCIPLRDALTIGYYLTVPVDLFVEQTQEGPIITWGAEMKIVNTQNSNQIKHFPVPDEYNKTTVFKFENPFIVTTPKGYSTFFTHPILNINSPFYSLSGFVDTDIYNVPVNFPFFIRNDFEGVISKGTPFIQFYPVKRDKWQIERTKCLTDIQRENNLNHLRTKFSGYKNLFWQRKEYN